MIRIIICWGLYWVSPLFRETTKLFQEARAYDKQHQTPCWCLGPATHAPWSLTTTSTGLMPREFVKVTTRFGGAGALNMELKTGVINQNSCSTDDTGNEISSDCNHDN